MKKSARYRIGYMVGAAVAVTGLTYLVLLADRETVLFLAGREQVLEALGAVLFLLSSIFSMGAYVRARRAPREPGPGPRHVYIFLSIFFLAAFGEEISWGQNIFNFSTPARIAKINQQEELNIHNLTLFDTYDDSGSRKSGIAGLMTANRLFDYFMIGLFMIIPAARRIIPSFRHWLTKRQITVIPGVFSSALILNLLLTAVSEIWLVDRYYLHSAVSEVREFNYAFLCLMAVLYLFLKERRFTIEL